MADDVRLGALGGQRVGQAVYGAGIYAAGDSVAKPACPAGLTPQIFVMPTLFSDNGTGSTLSAVQASAISAGAAAWSIVLRVRTEAGWVVPSAIYGRVAAFTKCS